MSAMSWAAAPMTAHWMLHAQSESAQRLRKSCVPQNNAPKEVAVNSSRDSEISRAVGFVGAACTDAHNIPGCSCTRFSNVLDCPHPWRPKYRQLCSESFVPARILQAAHTHCMHAAHCALTIVHVFVDVDTVMLWQTFSVAVYLSLHPPSGTAPAAPPADSGTAVQNVVQRRFRQFSALHSALRARYPRTPLPTLPGKQLFAARTPDFLVRRASELEAFLAELVCDVVLLCVCGCVLLHIAAFSPNLLYSSMTMSL